MKGFAMATVVIFSSLIGCTTHPSDKVQAGAPQNTVRSPETPDFLQPIPKKVHDGMTPEEHLECPCMMAIDYDAMTAWLEEQEKKEAQQ